MAFQGLSQVGGGGGVPQPTQANEIALKRQEMAQQAQIANQQAGLQGQQLQQQGQLQREEMQGRREEAKLGRAHEEKLQGMQNAQWDKKNAMDLQMHQESLAWQAQKQKDDIAMQEKVHTDMMALQKKQMQGEFARTRLALEERARLDPQIEADRAEMRRLEDAAGEIQMEQVKGSEQVRTTLAQKMAEFQQLHANGTQEQEKGRLAGKGAAREFAIMTSVPEGFLKSVEGQADTEGLGYEKGSNAQGLALANQFRHGLGAQEELGFTGEGARAGGLITGEETFQVHGSKEALKARMSVAIRDAMSKALMDVGETKVAQDSSVKDRLMSLVHTGTAIAELAHSGSPADAEAVQGLMKQAGADLDALEASGLSKTKVDAAVRGFHEEVRAQAEGTGGSAGARMRMAEAGRGVEGGKARAKVEKGDELLRDALVLQADKSLDGMRLALEQNRGRIQDPQYYQRAISLLERAMGTTHEVEGKQFMRPFDEGEFRRDYASGLTPEMAKGSEDELADVIARMQPAFEGMKGVRTTEEKLLENVRGRKTTRARLEEETPKAGGRAAQQSLKDLQKIMQEMGID